MDAIEFNSAARSLNYFLRQNKSVGLVVIDGIHFIENQEQVAQFEKRQVKQIVSAKNNNGNSVDALAAGPDVQGDDFFDISPAPNSATSANKPAAEQQQAHG